MSKIKVMSMLPRHNESTITSEGEISFDENNIAEVDEIIAKKLQEKGIVNILDSKPNKPISSNLETKKVVAEVTNIPPPSNLEEGEKLDPETGLINTDGVEAMEEAHQLEINKLKEDLKKKTNSELHEICESNSLPKDQWKGLVKNDLVDYIMSH